MIDQLYKLIGQRDPDDKRLEQAIRLLKMSLAAGLAWYLASLVSPHQNPYFAPLAVVITFQATVADTVAKAWRRIAGIVGGVAVCLLISQWFHIGAVTIAVAVLIGAAICTALRLDAQITSQVGVTVVMVLASSTTSHYAAYRIFESLLGAAIGVVVNAVLFPPDGLPLAEKRVSALADLLDTSLSTLSHAAQPARDTSGNPSARAIEAQMRSASRALRAADISIKLNPFLRNRRARLRELALAMAELAKLANEMREIARRSDEPAPGADRCRQALNAALKHTAIAGHD